MAQKSEKKDVWGPIDPKNWRATTCIRGRVARERDVKEGRAVYFLGNAKEVHAKPFETALPRCAILLDEDTGQKVPVVLIQAESIQDYAGRMIVVGYRLLNGGNGICALSDLELLDEPDERFDPALVR